MKSRAFTLIELLVVVLIIGILAAIALPQYQLAVNKSRYAGFMPLARSVKESEEHMHMATGNYTANLEQLDIQIPGQVNGKTVMQSDGTKLEVKSSKNYNYVKVSRAGLPNTYVHYFAYSKNFPGEIHCEAEISNSRAEQLCKTLGGRDPLTATDANYKAYVLEGTGNGVGSNGENWITYYNNNDLTLGADEKCVANTQGGCIRLNITDGGSCEGRSAVQSCGGGKFSYGSTCQGGAFQACSYSEFSDESVCTGYCTHNTFDNNSSCHGNGHMRCGFSSFTNGSVCYAEAGGACYGATYDETSCCSGQYCPDDAPKCS